MKTIAYPEKLYMIGRMFKRLCTLIITLLFAQQAFAAVFGQVHVRSHLGQPLDMSVPLTLSENEVSTQMSVMLAAPHEYKILEQLLPKSYPFIRADAVKTSPQQWDVRLTSSQPIDESFLTIILKIQRGRGNHFKKIQVFLDPESMGALKQKVKTLETSVSKQKVQETQPVQKASITTQKVPVAAVQLSGGWARRNSYGPVQYGDSLSEIAYRLRRDKRWSNRQVMLALYRENPNAFVRGDINQLKKGSFLNVPDDQEMQAFVESPRYQTLKRMLISRPVANQKKNNTKSMMLPTPISQPKRSRPSYRGKVSLGLSESLDAPIVNAMVLSRLEKLEPLYKQAVETDLRVDAIGGKVDSLASEVRSLHEKVDALSTRGFVGKSDSTSYGWWWFIFLLVINIVLLLVYLYRKQMKTWQEKLKRAHQEHTYDQSKHDIMVPSFADNQHQGTLMDDLDDGLSEVDLDAEKEEGNDALQGAGYADFGHIPAAMDDESMKVAINYTVAFEEAVHKRDWTYAQECYEKMDSTDQNRPRIQALYVQKLHGEGKLIDRNNKLVALFKRYDTNQWSRFCSTFDEDLWVELQDKGIINFTGNVVQSAVDLHNESIEKEDVRDVPVLDLSEANLNDISASDFPILNDVDKSEPAPLDKAYSLEDDISNKTVVMGSEEFKDWVEAEGKVNSEPLDKEYSLEDDIFNKTVLVGDEELKEWVEVEGESVEEEPLEGDFEIGIASEAEKEDDFFEVDMGDADATVPPGEDESVLARDKGDDLLDNTVLRDSKTHQENIEKLKDKMKKEELSFSFSDAEEIQSEQP